MDRSEEQRRSDDRDNLTGLAAVYAKWKPIVWLMGGTTIFLVGKLGGQFIWTDDRITKIEQEHQVILPAIERVENRFGDLTEIICSYVVQDRTGVDDRLVRQRCDNLARATRR